MIIEYIIVKKLRSEVEKETLALVFVVNLLRQKKRCEKKETKRIFAPHIDKITLIVKKGEST